MHSRALSLFCGLAFAGATAMAQSSTPAPAQPDSTDQSQQVGIAGQSNTPDATAQPAAPEQRRRPTPERQTRFLVRQLGLSPQQAAQIQPIIADRQQQIDALRSDTTLAPRDRRVRMRGVMQDSRTRIEAVLTDSQKQQFEQMLADRRARRQQQEQPQAQ